MLTRKYYWIRIGAILCLHGAVVWAEEPKPKQPTPSAEEIVIQSDLPFPLEGVSGTITVSSEGGPVQTVVVGSAGENGDAQGKYWIGLMCSPPGDALRAQLDLAADVGLLVDAVTDGGPATKAGIMVHDLLLTVTVVAKSESAPRPLKNLSDLVTAVQEAETGSIRLDFLRRGRKQSLVLIPEERPKSTMSLHVIDGHKAGTFAYGLRWAGPLVVHAESAPPLPEGMSMVFQPAEGSPEKVTIKQGDRVWEAEIKALDKLPVEIGALVQQQVAMRNAIRGRPANGIGHVFSTGASGGAARVIGAGAFGGMPQIVVHGSAVVIPDDLTVTIVRKGSDPAKVTIKRGDQTWEVTDKELDKLPMELRPVAESALTGRAVPQPHVFARATQVQPTPVQSTQSTPGAKVGMQNGTVLSVRSARNLEQEMKQLMDLVEKLRVKEELETHRLQKEIESLRQAVEKSQPKP